MKIIETAVYEYDELTASDAKARARDWFREVSQSDSDWSEFVIEYATTCGALLGIKIANVYFSGFSSQGDGACFVGQWHASDFRPGKLTENAPQDAELARIDREFASFVEQFPQASFSVRHRGRYSHSRSVEFDIELGVEETNAKEEENLKELARDFMDWIYASLEKEWTYQNSDETVADNIRANAYTFTSSGKRF